jgi:tRNA threonylcarbamoyladenosine biosynthesis protein TsaE
MRNNDPLELACSGYLSESSEDTMLFGRKFGLQLEVDSIVCLFGTLGAGKTTFIKGLAAGFADVDPREVNSPTFTYLNIYSGLKTLYHFDLYRLKGVDDFLSMGFEEYFHSGGMCCIEWSERVASILPKCSFFVKIDYKDADRRMIAISRGLP